VRTDTEMKPRELMKPTEVTIPEIMLIAGTRIALGAGAALLLADRLSREQRRAAGWALFLVGALSSIPLVIDVVGHIEPCPSSGQAEQR
jgi:hypothetical protein